jgi:hypothetical protein
MVAALRDEGPGRIVRGADSICGLAREAIERGVGLESLVARKGLGDVLDVEGALAEGRVLSPVSSTHGGGTLVSGTGLTHLGSAQSRDEMHRKLAGDALTDSMKIFKIGLEGGKPPPGRAGAQPEWFYKGDGSILAAPEQPLLAPDFGDDASEEAEIVGLYIVAPDGQPVRLGFALGNELSDHVMEQQNYLYLAHSKLRPCSIGPELRVGALPDEVKGVSRIRRQGEVVWESEFLSGETHMAHAIGNLEHHHFKHGQFRRPGDVHVHFFGAAVLSFSQGVRTEPGDVFEIQADAFRLPLRNPLGRVAGPPVAVRSL